MIIICTFANGCKSNDSSVLSHSEGNNANEVKENKKIEERYYGTWVVREVVSFARISAISNEEIQKLIGLRVVYSSDKAEFGSESIFSPFYIKTVFSEDEFFEHGYTNLSDIGIEEKFIERIKVFTKESYDYKDSYYGFGGYFFIKNDDVIIVDYKGAYFELSKVR